MGVEEFIGQRCLGPRMCPRILIDAQNLTGISKPVVDLSLSEQPPGHRSARLIGVHLRRTRYICHVIVLVSQHRVILLLLLPVAWKIDLNVN